MKVNKRKPLSKFDQVCFVISVHLVRQLTFKLVMYIVLSLLTQIILQTIIKMLKPPLRMLNQRYMCELIALQSGYVICACHVLMYLEVTQESWSTKNIQDT